MGGITSTRCATIVMETTQRHGIRVHRDVWEGAVMGITDELRKWAEGSTLSSRTAEHLTAIVDRIDAAVASEYVRLPKDADGEVWHVGDLAVGEVNPNNPKAVERMIWYGPDSGWQLETDTIIYPCPDRPRHHRAPTVDNLLFSYGQSCIRASNEAETEAAKQTMLAKLREDYAAKLRLADD